MGQIAYKILLVDDELTSLAATQALLESRGFAVDTATSGDEGIRKVKASPSRYALAIIDFRMPARDGASTAEGLLSVHPDLIVLIHSADDTRQALQSSWEAGARRFVEKSEDPEVFISTVRRWYRKFENEHATLSLDLSPNENAMIIQSLGLVGRSRAMADIAAQVQRYAPLSESVLILGETGVGKERIARALHLGRPDRWVADNCARFHGSAELMESELFGHVKGSFTGAHADKVGLFSMAEGGTLFLDEIHTLSLVAQRKLLRALQEKKIRRVGASHESPINFRLIAAGKPDLPQMANRNEFAPDLYERLNVLRIVIPPLRQRKEDIEPLVAHFCQEINREKGLNISFQLRTIRKMEEYDWPRNVRELEHMVIRLCIDASKNTITPEDFAAQIDASVTDTLEKSHSLKLKLSNFEKSHLVFLVHNSSSIREAARKAKLPETTFRRMMHKHGITQVAKAP